MHRLWWSGGFGSWGINLEEVELIRSRPFSAWWKYSSIFLSLTTIYQIMAVLIRRKIWGGGFQFIWFHSWNRIMNRLFASLPLPNRDGETKGKMMATKKAEQTKDCHKDKADHSPVCIRKKGQKRAQNLQKMAAPRQSSLGNYNELGPQTSW